LTNEIKNNMLTTDERITIPCPENSRVTIKACGNDETIPKGFVTIGSMSEFYLYVYVPFDIKKKS